MSNKLIDINALSNYKTSADAKYQDKLTAGNCISLNSNAVSAGATFVDPGFSNVSIANATWVTVSSLTLAPGNYIFMYTCQFSSNSSGYRRSVIVPSGGTSINDYRKAVNGYLSNTQIVAMFQVSATEYPNGRTFEFRIRQNSGSTLTAYPRAGYIKF